MRGSEKFIVFNKKLLRKEKIAKLTQHGEETITAPTLLSSAGGRKGVRRTHTGGVQEEVATPKGKNERGINRRVPGKLTGKSVGGRAKGEKQFNSAKTRPFKAGARSKQ